MCCLLSFLLSVESVCSPACSPAVCSPLLSGRTHCIIYKPALSGFNRTLDMFPDLCSVTYFLCLINIHQFAGQFSSIMSYCTSSAVGISLSDVAPSQICPVFLTLCYVVRAYVSQKCQSVYLFPFSYVLFGNGILWSVLCDTIVQKNSNPLWRLITCYNFSDKPS